MLPMFMVSLIFNIVGLMVVASRTEKINVPPKDLLNGIKRYQ